MITLDINIPSQVRGWLYVICGLGSLAVTYLAATHAIGVNEVALWTGFTAFVGGLARFNLTPNDDE